MLLDAAENLLNQKIPVTVDVIGGFYNEPAYEKQITERVCLGPLNGKVQLVGAVEHRQIPDFLRCCAVYVQPSRYESQGTALVEAMAAGCPVIASDLPAIREYISHGTNGILFTPEDAADLTEKLLELYSEQKRSKQLVLRHSDIDG